MRKSKRGPRVRGGDDELYGWGPVLHVAARHFRDDDEGWAAFVARLPRR